MNPSSRGILCILVSGLLLASNDAISKWLVPFYPPGQIIFSSSISVVFVSLVLIKLILRKSIKIQKPWTHLLRGIFFAVAFFAFVVSLGYMPLATAMCIAFAGPLFMTLMGKFILGEEVGRYRLGAVIAGFIGVLIMINPSTDRFEWFLLIPLIVAIGDAARDILTRYMTKTEDSFVIVFTTAFTVSIIAVFSFNGEWVLPTPNHLILFLATGVLMVAAYFLMVEAYRFATTVVIAPFRYIQIIWGIVAGFIIWGEIPGLNIYAGLLLTAGSGIVIAYREHKSHQDNS